MVSSKCRREGEAPLDCLPKLDRSKDEVILRDPHFLADGKTLVMVIRRPGPGYTLDTIAVQSVLRDPSRFGLETRRSVNVVSLERTGHLLFFVGSQPILVGGCWAVPFFFSNLKTTDLRRRQCRCSQRVVAR